MKTTNILFWTFTGLFSFLMLGSAIPDVLLQDMAVQGMHGELGYPVYFIPFIGLLKCLGVIAILVPGYPRLKEWAYAGLFFDLLGATYSILASGAPAANAAFMIMPVSLAVLSYVFYRKKQQLANSLAKI